MLSYPQHGGISKEFREIHTRDFFKSKMFLSMSLCQPLQYRIFLQLRVSISHALALLGYPQSHDSSLRLLRSVDSCRPLSSSKALLRSEITCNCVSVYGPECTEITQTSTAAAEVLSLPGKLCKLLRPQRFVIVL